MTLAGQKEIMAEDKKEEMESMDGSFVEYYSDRRMHVFLLHTSGRYE